MQPNPPRRALPLAVALALLASAPLALAGAQPAAAPPPPLAQTSGDLDGDGQPEKVALERDGRLHVESADGRALGELKLAVAPSSIESAKLQVTHAEGHPLVHAILRLSGGKSFEAVAALEQGKLDPLFAERTGPVGDGERQVKLTVGDAGVVRYQTASTIVRCDGDDMVFPERWDFSSHRFRPVDEDPPSGPLLRATTTRPPTLPDEPLGLFHFTGESTDPAAAAERRADQLASPHELEDHQPGTTWVAGPPGGGRGAWVTARAQEATHAVTTVEIVPGPGPAPKKLALVFPDKTFSVELPPLPSRGPFWVTLPQPVKTSCVSLVIAEPPPARGSPSTSLAEVGIFTDADRAGGLAELANDVATGGPQATAAAEILQQRGAAAAQAIGQLLPTATGASRRRLVELLASLGVTDAAPALGRELSTAPADERDTVVAGLSRLGADGAVQAEKVYSDSSQTGEARTDAARVLGAVAKTGAVGSDAATRALVAGLGLGDASTRAATIGALGQAGAGNPKVAGALVAAAKQPDEAPSETKKEVAPAPRRRADLARALGEAGRGAKDRDEVARSIAELYRSSDDFEVRYKALKALGALGDPAGAPTLAEAARSSDEILRWAAVTAAGRLGEAGRATLLQALGDADPRVRRAAIAGLGTQLGSDGVTKLESLLSSDHWSMDRRAAAEALASACATPSVPSALERAVAGQGDDARGADPSEEVRRAALVSLAHCAPRSPVIARVLRSGAQPVAVRELAAAMIARTGGPGAAEALAQALSQVLDDPNADERTAGLAVACLRGLERTNDTSRPILEALGTASSDPSSPAIRAAAQETIGKLCPDGADAAFKRGVKDPDPQVRRATEHAKRICPK